MLKFLKRAGIGLVGATAVAALAAGSAGATPGGFGPTSGGQPVVQYAQQSNGITQQARAVATSKQVAPVDVNSPVSVLSLWSNDGKVTQANLSEAGASASNRNWSKQANRLTQTPKSTHGNRRCDPRGRRGRRSGRKPGHGWGNPGGPGSQQKATQGNSIGQNAQAESTSTQILPVNANVPVSVLSSGSNNGSVTQGNVSSANSTASNRNHSTQSNQAGQHTTGLLGSIS